jgi:hypothetical protein
MQWLPFSGELSAHLCVSLRHIPFAESASTSVIFEFFLFASH